MYVDVLITLENSFSRCKKIHITYFRHNFTMLNFLIIPFFHFILNKLTYFSHAPLFRFLLFLIFFIFTKSPFPLYFLAIACKHENSQYHFFELNTFCLFHFKVFQFLLLLFVHTYILVYVHKRGTNAL